MSSSQETVVVGTDQQRPVDDYIIFCFVIDRAVELDGVYSL